ncbi:LysR family transcriptional regulator [Granulosicoccus sp. 3-233]|uniref:LysR family transcriptional regulator n=1 Tax=Granulosicoccus sp. 3-233 TaxID=3417969 RepID=UPI003D3358EF
MSGRVSLRQLIAYRAIMTAGSVSVAANDLNLSQPALSKQIAALEDALGIRLFSRRRGGPMIPTRAGVELFKSIEGTISGIDLIPQIAREIAEHSRVRLRVAATPPLLNSAPFMRALIHFREKNPSVRLALEARRRIDIEEWVYSRQVDVALALLPLKNPLLFSKPLLKSRAVVVVSADHPLARRTRVNLSDLASSTVILPSRQPLRDQIDACIRGLPEAFSVDIESSSSLTCCKLAAAGLGVAICDPFSPTAFSSSEVRVLKLEPAIKLAYGAIMHRTSDVSGMTGLLLDAVTQEFKAI